MKPETILINVREVGRRLGLSRSAIYKLLESEPQFPRPCYPAPRAPRWRADEIAAWVERLSEARAAA